MIKTLRNIIGKRVLYESIINKVKIVKSVKTKVGV